MLKVQYNLQIKFLLKNDVNTLQPKICTYFIGVIYVEKKLW